MQRSRASCPAVATRPPHNRSRATQGEPVATASTTAPSKAVDQYLHFIAHERGLADHTVSNYKRELEVLSRCLTPVAESLDSKLGRANPEWIRQSMASWHRSGLSPSSIARRLSAWRSFFDWAGRQKLVEHNPLRSIHAPKAGKRLPKALAPDQAIALMENGIHGESPSAVRDQALLELLYSCGLRLSEVISLDARYMRQDKDESIGWIEWDQAQANVLGKGRKRRTVPIGKPALQALEAWMAVRGEWLAVKNQPECAALFINRKCLRISAREVQRIVARSGKQAGIPAKVHPHVLRHSFASHILQSSSDLRAVQELLGHANISTTQIYTSLDFQRLAQVYDASHPRAKRSTK